MSNFERIIPVLTYQDIPAAHDFLVNAFGFTGGGVDRHAEGQPRTMSMPTTSGRARPAHSSILNRSINHMGSASMARGILKGTDGGLRLRWRSSVRVDHNAHDWDCDAGPGGSRAIR